MQRAITAAVGVAVVSLVMTGTAMAGDGFRTFPTCGEDTGEDSHCIIGNGWGATFIARAGGREKYKLCVDPPNGPTSCRKRKTDRDGEDFDRLYTEYDRAGTYHFVWKKGGHVLDRDRLDLGIGD